MNHNLNSLKGVYIGDHIGLLGGILGRAQTHTMQLPKCYNRVIYWGNIGMMEKKMETLGPFKGRYWVILG